MEKQESKSFNESEIFNKPMVAFNEVVERIGTGAEMNEYLAQVLTTPDSKEKYQQDLAKRVLRKLLDEGKKEEAGLVFNMHRVLTGFRGYDANEKASGDVETFFGEGKDFPEKGLIVVDFFVTRNLPEIVKMCEAGGIDLSRIRVSVPKGILAVQLMKMNDEKRVEFEAACSKLEEDQFIVEDVNHVSDIKVEGETAMWFSPRTMPINPKLHAETEADTIDNYREWFKERVNSVVAGGRIYANLAYAENWRPLDIEEVEGKRPLTKLTGISRNVAAEVARTLTEDSGFRFVGKGEFNPADVDKEIDHAKLATELHMVKG